MVTGAGVYTGSVSSIHFRRFRIFRGQKAKPHINPAYCKFCMLCSSKNNSLSKLSPSIREIRAISGKMNPNPPALNFRSFRVRLSRLINLFLATKKPRSCRPRLLEFLSILWFKTSQN